MTRHAEPSAVEITNELSKWAVGGGMLTLVLFPLALPFLVLTAVALIPLVVPLVVVGIVGGVLAIPVLLGRRLRRRYRRESPSGLQRTHHRSGVPTGP